MQARVEFIPFDRVVQSGMLPKYLVVLNPAWSTMTLSLSNYQAAICEQIACLGVWGEDCHICQKGRHPSEGRLYFP